jgi:hypothetical protein
VPPTLADEPPAGTTAPLGMVGAPGEERPDGVPLFQPAGVTPDAAGRVAEIGTGFSTPGERI